MSQQTSRVRRLVPIEATPASLVKIFFLLFAVFAVVVIVFPLHHTIELWDESRNANNAIEIAMRGHWLAPTFDWMPDHWNTKPPLLIWVIAALYKLGLPPMVALRLPSSVAALGSVLLAFCFCTKVLRRPFVGVVAALMMMSSSLYFGNHAALNGDFDSLLCLFTTLYALGFFCFVERIEPYTTAGIVLAPIALVGAILTKGVAGSLLLPGLFLYLVIRGRLMTVVKDRRFWIAIACSVAAVLLYYKGRDLIDPGYIKAVLENELGGRYGKPKEGHGGRTIFYLMYLDSHFEPGILLTVLGVWAMFRRPDVRADSATAERGDISRALAMFTAVVAVVLLAILSKSKTQIFYYCSPCIPLLSLLAAVGVGDVLQWWTAKQDGTSKARTYKVQWVVFLVLVIVTAVGLPTTLRQRVRVAGEWQGQYRDAIQDLAQVRDSEGNRHPIEVIDGGFEDPAFSHYAPIAEYYVKEAERRGVPIRFTQSLEDHPAGTWLLTCDPKTAKALVESRVLAASAGLESSCVYGQSAR